jgi:two-component system, NarL family, sensor histidine kinase DesK
LSPLRARPFPDVMHFAYARLKMPPRMLWLATVIRLAITPVFLGALFLLLEPQRSGRSQVAALGLVLLGAIHLLYWWSPWPAGQRRAVAAAGAMVLTNFLLLHVLDLSEPLVWLYPALVVGAGLRPPAAALGVGLMAGAAVVPAEMDGLHLIRMLGPSHAIVLAVVLAGLGMTAVRQLIALNATLHTTRAELAELAVTRERERLARELHDLLGRTLSLIAVKAELAAGLSARGDPSAEAELRDVQRLARLAVREVREAVAGDHTPSVAAELASAQLALQAAGIEVSVDNALKSVDPAHEATVAWVLREAVTNVVKHSGARSCHVSLEAADGVTALQVVDDGYGPDGESGGMGLAGLADRVHALGGAFEAGRREAGGFQLRVRLGAAAVPRQEVAR